jgi:hypothetical protein
VPLGLFAIFAVLFVTACVNLLTKRVATISGSIFTLSFFTVFTISEKINKRKKGHAAPTDKDGLTEHGHVDPVNMRRVLELSPQSCGLERDHCILVAVRDPRNLVHLKRTLKKFQSARDTDIVAMTSKVAQGYQLEGDIERPTEEEEILFTQIIALAERAGHTVIPLMVPSNDPFYAMAQTVNALKADELILGKSEKYSPEVQMEQIAVAWGAVRPAQGHPLRIRILF